MQKCSTSTKCSHCKCLVVFYLAGVGVGVFLENFRLMIMNESNPATQFIEHCQIHKTSKCSLLLSKYDLHQCLLSCWPQGGQPLSCTQCSLFSNIVLSHHRIDQSGSLVNEKSVRSEAGQTAECQRANMMQIFCMFSHKVFRNGKNPPFYLFSLLLSLISLLISCS